MRALAVLIWLVAAAGWYAAGLVLLDLLDLARAIAAHAAPGLPGLRQAVLLNQLLGFAAVALLATIGAAILWRLGRPGAPRPAPPHEHPVDPRGLAPGDCPHCGGRQTIQHARCRVCGFDTIARRVAGTG